MMKISKTKFKNLELIKNKEYYLLALPGMIVLLLFSYIPLNGIVLAFKDYNIRDGIWGSPWSGFEKFSFFFTYPSRVWQVTFNTLYLNAMFIIAGLFFSVSIAILINELKNKHIKKFLQSAIFLPYFVSWVVVGALVYSFFAEIGFINTILNNFGLESISFYRNEEYWRPILVGVHLWKFTGYSSIIYLAVIVNIDDSLFESAVVDGATRLQQIRYITIPHLIPTVVLLVLLAIGRIMYGDFGMMFAILKNNPLLNETTQIIDTYVYGVMISLQDFSLSTAIGLYQSFVGMILVISGELLARKFNGGEGLF